MEVLRDPRQMTTLARERRRRDKKIGFVPTMGYLHEGHLDLVKFARANSDLTVVSIFVNPKQFGPLEDLAQYPRDMDRDLELLRPLGVDVVFNPEPAAMYPKGFQAKVEVAEITKGLCGAFRPDFFPGVTTVVLKLFNIILPHLAIFGEKDFQQLATIKRMVLDLNLDIEVIGRPTFREPDGLAMSSRNTYLNPEQRKTAGSLHQALNLARDLVRRGETKPEPILAAVRRHIDGFPETEIQYAALVDPLDLKEVDRIKGPTLLALAVFVGKTRLIDNMIV
ncbi:MAG: pantoate--beta-alanine ligase [Pseudomonadota bacterium]